MQAGGAPKAGRPMAANVTNELLLEHLKAIQGRLAVLENGQSDIKSSIISIQQHMAGFMTGITGHESAIASIQARLDRIERRLELQG